MCDRDEKLFTAKSKLFESQQQKQFLYCLFHEKKKHFYMQYVFNNRLDTLSLLSLYDTVYTVNPGMIFYNDALLIGKYYRSGYMYICELIFYL